jgi:hypothetical protein
VTIESKKSPKGLDDHQKGDDAIVGKVEGQTTQIVGVQGIEQHILAE